MPVGFWPRNLTPRINVKSFINHAKETKTWMWNVDLVFRFFHNVVVLLKNAPYLYCWGMDECYGADPSLIHKGYDLL